MKIEQARTILRETKPKRRRRDRYRQRDELQHQIIPLLELRERDAFEQQLNNHFRL